MNFETIIYKATDDGICTLSINRPEALNALNNQVLHEMLQAIHKAGADDAVKVVILTGEGRAFVSGADIEYMKNLSTKESLAFADLGHSVVCALEGLAKPVIAAVNGFALGGGLELAMGCDFIYASRKAKFGQPEVNLGVIPGFGGTQRLPRLVGISKARELIYTGQIIPAEEAKRIGIVSEVFDPEELIPSVHETASQLISKGLLAIASAKRIINKGVDLSLDAALELEKQAFSAIFGSEDQTEGMTAFIEKRKAEFKYR